jgi:hypothetical protein
MGRGGYIGGSTVFRIWGFPRSDPKDQVKKDFKLLDKVVSTSKSEEKIYIIAERLKKNIPKLAKSNTNLNYLAGILPRIKSSKYFDQNFKYKVSLLTKNAQHRYRSKLKLKKKKKKLRYDRYGPLP